MPNEDQRDDDFGGLGSRFLEDALGGSAPMDRFDDDAPRQTEPTRQAEPPAPKPQTGGIRPLLERKRREIIELEKKIETHRQTKVYEAKDQSGNPYFDYLAMQEDQAKLQRFNREYGELRDRERELQVQTQNRSAQVREIAQTILRREIQGMEEHLRRPTAEMFASILKSTIDGGTLNRPEYASREAITRVIDQMIDAAYGSALRKSRSGDQGGAPAPSGMDSGHEPKPKKPTEDDEDDFTNNLMYAYNRRKQRSMTVAEAKRAAAEQEKGVKR